MDTWQEDTCIQFVTKFQKSKSDSYLRSQTLNSLCSSTAETLRYSLLSHPLHESSFYMKTYKSLQCTPCAWAQKAEAPHQGDADHFLQQNLRIPSSTLWFFSHGSEMWSLIAERCFVFHLTTLQHPPGPAVPPLKPFTTRPAPPLCTSCYKGWELSESLAIKLLQYKLSQQAFLSSMFLIFCNTPPKNTLSFF